ncbi:MAG TPA: FAD-dependent oxidoreductase [Vicinamibacteria bacterium]|nr:FAD-dependent oxidoreductase [Vicinamibacteria bacterium]
MRRDVAALAAGPHDVLVVGGGIYGVTAAFEAARRGLKVALVDALDFGAGVSWNSLKTIHGGLRHLQRLDLASHRESVRERRTLMLMAPALVRPLPFLVPTYGHGLKGREAFGIGLLVNDLLSIDRNRGIPAAHRLPAGRLLGPKDTLSRVPGLPADGLSGGALWCDAQVESSERLVMAFVQSAVAAGAEVANHCEAVALLRSGTRVVGARVRDVESGVEHEVKAGVVLNAAGPGAARLLASAGIPASVGPMLMAVNLVFDERWPLPDRLAVGARAGGRYLFLVPWRKSILAGTEYWTEQQHSGAEAVASFQQEVARAFPWAGLGASKVALVHRGLVPGEGGAEGLATRPRFLDHELRDGVPGLLTVQGAKYTTARAVAERAVRLLGLKLGRPLPDLAQPLQALAGAGRLEGSLTEQVRRAIRDEMARSLADVVLRRLDLGTAGPPAEDEVTEVAAVMAGELGWDEARKAVERAALARFYQDAYNGTQAMP